ncbi:MAG: pyruvate ferredoxin oxidoreductase [Comamonadaceae bacterium]|nr:pyruvate ferredoxin oxidoreductase [Comamonadaceae bacterium]
MSVAIGASAAGARAYTATASQGLLFMAEAVYNASGLGLPIVMTVANRAIGAPINIWNDHSDSMSQRDCGWIQLFAETNQEALDLHIQAFKLGEELSLPVMVCMDGFILTHAVRARRHAARRPQVDAFLPPYEPRQVLDPAEPVSIGAMVGPEAFMEVRYLAHAKQMHGARAHPARSPPSSPRASAASAAGWSAATASTTPKTVVVALGSVLGTLKDTVDELRDEGVPDRRAGHHLVPAVPAGRGARRAATARSASSCWRRASRSVWAAWCRPTCGWRCRASHLHGYTVVAGLGGRAITQASLLRMLREAVAGTLPAADASWTWTRRIVERQLAREAAVRRSGPVAENLLRDVGSVASKVA